MATIRVEKIEQLVNDSSVQGEAYNPTKSESNYCDTIIYIQSSCREKWLKVAMRRSFGCLHHGLSKGLSFCEISEKRMLLTPTVKWRVKDAELDDDPEAVLLENVYHNNYYLNAQHSGGCMATYSENPKVVDSMRWRMEKTDAGDTFRIRSLSKTFHVNGMFATKVLLSRQAIIFVETTFRVYRPPIFEHWELILSFDNSRGTTDVKSVYTMREGTYLPGITEIQIDQLLDEIRQMLVTEGEHKDCWRSTTTRMVEKQMEITIDAGVHLHIYQLVGIYGPYKTFSNLCKIVPPNDSQA